MKKLLSFVFLAIFMLVLVGCGEKKYEIALVTDEGTIDDKSFNQGSWEGVKLYAEKHNKTHKHYQPASKKPDDYKASIELAIKGGAKIVVTPGFYFAPVIGEIQTKYPDITFILIDAEPTVDNEVVIKDNVVPVLFNDHESGFLAGYAAVKDGFTKLGFMGGSPVPAVRNFGYGYLQGADYAAEELGIENIEVKYHYLESFTPNAAHTTKAKAWYQGGTEVIFVAAGGAGNSVMAAAEEFKDNDGKYTRFVIGVDVDQKHESETVITSAMKGITDAVYYVLENLEDCKGKTQYIDIFNGIALPDDFSRMNEFDKDDYDAIVKKLKEDENLRKNIKTFADFNNETEQINVEKLAETLSNLTVTYE